MNERFHHNNPWADKLSQVSLPDRGEAWKSMEALLDKEMPKDRGKDRRRWLLLLFLLLLLIGVCNCPGRGRIFGHKDDGRRNRPDPAKLPPVAGASAAFPTTGNGDFDKAKQAARGEEPGNGDYPRAGDIRGEEHLPHAKDKSGEEGDGESPIADAIPARTGPMDKKKIPGETRMAGKKKIPREKGSPGSGIRRSRAGKKGYDKQKEDGAVSSGTQSPRDTLARQNPANSLQPADSLPRETGSHPAGPGGKGQKPVAKDSTRRPPVKPRAASIPPEESKKRNGAWMAGIGVNQFFPVGKQQPGDYKPDGVTGTLRDYIPVPMIRYYFGRKGYIQLEAQFNSPQYVQKNLVINVTKPDSISPAIRKQNSVSINRLFYFNLPLSVHYAITRRLTLGAGLQYSRLSNGIGFYQDRFQNVLAGTPDSTTVGTVKSFKGDSLYKRIRTDEFRLLLDASYTWKHFIFGLRYNQAFEKFVNIQVSPGQVTQSRNSSLQLYLRYILWDNRKKHSDGTK